MAKISLQDLLLSDRLRKSVDDLVSQSSAVEVLSYILGRPKLYEWALTVGALSEDVLRSQMPPLPDEELRKVNADHSPELFLWTGLSDIHAFLGVIETYGGLELNARKSWLDFGCGCGRLLRFVDTSVVDVHGVDVNARHIEWCRLHLPSMRFLVNAPLPPLQYESGKFDAIWAFSVFSHLSPRASELWRSELARVLSPGGILLITLHGETALAKVRSSPDLAERVGWSPGHIERVSQELAHWGYSYVKYELTSLLAAQAGDDYGLSYVSKGHVYEVWCSDSFDILEYREGGLRGWQDLLVLRRR